jgi:RNA recognition motif-containing protein
VETGHSYMMQIGDIPDADARPPDNVLFVCKLNPITRDEDLEIIFSRFGPIKRCAGCTNLWRQLPDESHAQLRDYP